MRLLIIHTVHVLVNMAVRFDWYRMVTYCKVLKQTVIMFLHSLWSTWQLHLAHTTGLLVFSVWLALHFF